VLYLLMCLLFFLSLTPPPPTSSLFPYTTLFRSRQSSWDAGSCTNRSGNLDRFGRSVVRGGEGRQRGHENLRQSLRRGRVDDSGGRRARPNGSLEPGARIRP